MSQNEVSQIFILMGMSYGVERVGRARPQAEAVVGGGRRGC